MSHSWKGSNGTVVIYNPDLSGDVLINGTAVNGCDLLDFIADYVRDTRISQLENMESRMLLDLAIWNDA
jgi:hypothetical protein